MLSYAFQVLKQTNFEKIKSEEFENMGDLFACILYRCVSQQLKQGLHREYVVIDEDISTVRGKINITQTIKNKIKHKQLISCNHDEYSENNLFNQIIKTTIDYLICSNNIKKEYKKALYVFSMLVLGLLVIVLTHQVDIFINCCRFLSATFS